MRGNSLGNGYRSNPFGKSAAAGVSVPFSFYRLKHTSEFAAAGKLLA
jgi:hypothetical protein